jgi:hypothetical protein
VLRGGAAPPPSLPYKVDTSRPSLRTNWTRLVPLARQVSIINMCKMKQRGATDAEAGAKCTRSADIKATERSEMLELRFADAWPLIHKAPNLWCPRPPPNRPLLPYPSPYASPYRTPPHPPLQL